MYIAVPMIDKIYVARSMSRGVMMCMLYVIDAYVMSDEL